MTRLIARRLEFDDLPTRVRWLNSPSVYSQMVIGVPISVSETQQWFRNTLLKPNRDDFCFELVDGAGIVGAMGGLIDIDRTNRRAELYIVVDPERTGRGIGKTAISWICNFGFNQLALQRIYLHTLPNNERARRLYESLGFIHEGVMRCHVCHNGKFVDRFIHGLLRSEWKDQEWSVDGISPLQCLPIEDGTLS